MGIDGKGYHQSLLFLKVGIPLGIINHILWSGAKSKKWVPLFSGNMRMEVPPC